MGILDWVALVGVGLPLLATFAVFIITVFESDIRKKAELFINTLAIIFSGVVIIVIYELIGTRLW